MFLYQQSVPTFWLICDSMTDVVFILDIIVQLRTGYLEQGLMVSRPEKNGKALKLKSNKQKFPTIKFNYLFTFPSDFG